MSILDKDKIDFLYIVEDRLFLVMTDHMEWTGKWDGVLGDGEHIFLLQEKINAYFGAIESGEIYEVCKEALNKQIIIKIVGKFDTNENGDFFLEKAQEAARKICVDVKFELSR